MKEQGYVPPSDPDLPYELAAEQYRRGVLAGRSVARDAGVPVVHLWQPQLISVSGGRPYLPEVPRLARISEGSIESGPEAVRRVAEMSGVDPIDLSGAFDGRNEPLFFDGAHTNERGARILAAAMWEQLEPLVAKAEASR
jgi:lysophospholipase L1-like esterase